MPCLARKTPVTDSSIGRTWNLYASSSRSTYWHIGPKRWVELHLLDHPIVPVLVEEWLGDVRDPSVTHYGWESGEIVDGKCGVSGISMIWPRARGGDCSPWVSLGMCFPYGMQAEIDAGKGKMIALRILAMEVANQVGG